MHEKPPRVPPAASGAILSHERKPSEYQIARIDSLRRELEDAASQLEYPTCPFCKSDRRELPLGLSPPYRLARCLGCGAYYLYPRLSENAMQEVYRKSTYFEGGTCGYSDTSYAQQEPALRATFRRLMHTLRDRGLAGGDLLEIGCGYGYLLDEAGPFFRRRVGTEFSLQAADRTRRTNAEVFVGGIEQLPQDSRFDCIIATQVIEHVYEPQTFLSQLVRHGKPGGHIVLATPDVGNLLRKLMGRRWPAFKAPEHVIYYDFPRLRSLMQGAGLEKIHRLPYPHAFPLGLISTKFGLSLPPRLGRMRIWVPGTTVAAYGVVRT